MKYKTPEKEVFYIAGFTLLEVLLAILIFGILMTIVFGSFHAVFSGADVVEEHIRADEMAQECLNRIVMDLKAVQVTPDLRYAPPEQDNPPDGHRIVGESRTESGESFAQLRFSSAAHLPIERRLPGGVAEIVYYVTGSPEAGYFLRRFDRVLQDTPFEEPGDDPILCANVKSIQFRFFDDAAEEHETWDSDDSGVDYATPRAIGILLEIGNDENSYLYRSKVFLPVFRGRKEDAL